MKSAGAVQGHGTKVHRIAVLGNHVPKQCGIATFTTDLSEAISAEFPAADSFVVATNDGGQSYAYPETGRFEIAEADQPAYLRAADFLNVNEVEITCVQHEYGIFGGQGRQPHPRLVARTSYADRNDAPHDSGKPWAEQAQSAFTWFFGENQLEQALHDLSTGGCRDGLHCDRVNENQGAESTLCFLLSLLEMRASHKGTVMNPRLTRGLPDRVSPAEHELAATKRTA